ncbi:MAG: TatD family hydrolase, partial [Crocinitomicaceae bacterium]
MIDTHTHIYSSRFDEDRDEVLERAFQSGVKCMLLPNIDLESVEPMLNLCSKYDRCIPVGEIGIDLYWDKTFLKQQLDAFRIQIKWAKELDLPIVIHARDSYPEIFEVLDEENTEELRGVFHCFSGSLGDAKHILSYGGFK